MKTLFKNIFYFFPVQLLVLHFRKYQIVLLFWFILFSTLNGGFMKSFGASGLFFAPEYLDNVSFFSAFLVGLALGMFVMSWHVTTFILHSKRFKFLAATSKPFLKYCINNSILPILFILFYLIKMNNNNVANELMSKSTSLLLIAAILAGHISFVAFSFLFFFGADKTILWNIAPIISDNEKFMQAYNPDVNKATDYIGIKAKTYLSTKLKIRKVRSVAHYNVTFLDMLFKRHHIAAIFSIVLAFIFLAVIGFLLDNKFFQPPAAASILVFFGIGVSVIGASTYFLQSWSLPFAIALVLVLNILYQKEIIDPRNKAYGLNYNNKADRPIYDKEALNKLCAESIIKKDKENMLLVLNNWKQKQQQEKPMIVFVNVSGGGLRSGTFVMNTLQHVDSLTNGELMKKTFLITGASGGMLAATYYRELYNLQLKDKKINRNDSIYTTAIAQDLLNPIFSSMVTRDIFSPAQKFNVGDYKYVKDRGYAFEKKLNANTNYILNKQLSYYVDDEKKANIPLTIFNSTITNDGRSMLICTQPISFLMKPIKQNSDSVVVDGVDFCAMFKNQNPYSLRMLTALRMNATFPYVLPNVWLPTNPVIDVMDAGLNDNFGQNVTLRFIDNFKEWIKTNTSGVLILQIRDRQKDNWQPNENLNDNISGILIKPVSMLQYNWFKLQNNAQANEYSYLQNSFDSSIQRLSFIYKPQQQNKGAALSFHLTASEKKDIEASFYNLENTETLQKVIKALRH